MKHLFRVSVVVLSLSLSACSVMQLEKMACARGRANSCTIVSSLYYEKQDYANAKIYAEGAGFPSQTTKKRVNRKSLTRLKTVDQTATSHIGLSFYNMPFSSISIVFRHITKFSVVCMPSNPDRPKPPSGLCHTHKREVPGLVARPK